MLPAALLVLGALVAQPLMLPAPAAPGSPEAKRSAFNTLLARHAAGAMLKQLSLDDQVGKEATVDVDLEAGTLRFGKGPTHPVQLLGTEASGDRTWLWAWANADSKLPPQLVVAAGKLRKVGTERQLQELFVKRLPLDEADGHRLSAIAVGLLGAGSYYRGPYGSGERQGAAYYLLTDFPRPAQLDQSPPRLIRAVEMALSVYEVDHRAVVRGLAADLKLKLAEKPGALVVTAAKGTPVEFRFDDQGRLTKATALLGQAGR